MPTALIVLVFVAFIPYVLAALGGYAKIKYLGKLDNNHPRVQAQELKGTGARIVASQLNAWEALGLYTAVLFICYSSGVYWSVLEIPALVFGLSRVLHPVLYIANLATLRSLNVMIGVVSCAYMVSQAF